jgi:hypothetical protein
MPRQVPRRRVLFVAFGAVMSGCVPSPWNDGRVFVNVYYVSPTGNDSATGTSSAEPWQTFAHAFTVMAPGDALVLEDGIYEESLAPPPSLSGTTTSHIAIGAQHDGQAWIDGAGTRIPIDLRGNDYFDIQGIVAYNSRAGVVVLEPNGADPPTYNTLRRISAYNTAATCTTPGDSVCNHQLFELWSADHTLIEDCAAAGRARSIAYAFQSSYTTWRRCWFRGDQGTGWSSDIADHDGYASYQADHTVFENNILADPAPNAFGLAQGVHDWNNVYGGPDTQVNVANQYFGNVVGSISENGIGIGATQCKLSRDHVFDNNVVVQSQTIASAWRRGLAIRLGKNLSFAHLTLIGDSAGETGTEQQGIWVSASVFSDQDPDCSPLNSQGQHFGAWGFYPDMTGGTPVQHRGFDFTMSITDSVVQGFRVGFEAATTDSTPPVITNDHNNVQGNTTNYLGSATAGPHNTSVALTWDDAKYGKGAYLMGATNAPLGDDGKPVGARVLYESENGTLTSTPLWPFPMEDRVWNETGDTRLWEGANPLYHGYQQSPTWDGVTVDGQVRTGGWWQTLDGVYS